MKFNQDDFDEWKNNDKKNIVVVDFDFLCDYNNKNLELFLSNPNIHLIVLNCGYSSFDSEIFEQLGPNALLINKKDSLHKKFYKKVVKKITENMSETAFLKLTKNLNNKDLLVFRKGTLKFLKQV
jgi:hypothetical protein